MGALLTGCFSEDYSFCPPDESAVTIHFRLPDPVTRSGDTFADEITTVTTAIYDEQGDLAKAITTYEYDHEEFQGLQLTLPAGTYRLVSWANSTSATQINDLNTHYDVPTWLDYSRVNTGRLVDQCDPLFYAPDNNRGEYEFFVDPEDGHEGILYFRHAQRRVLVYVKGFEHVSSNNSSNPIVRLTGLPAGLEFLGMSSIDEAPVNTQAQSKPVSVKNVAMALSTFQAFYLSLQDRTVGVELLDPATREVVYTTTLNAHIDPETDNPEIDKTLEIVIEFDEDDPGTGEDGQNVEVDVKLPPWTENEVEYDYWRK